jgi:hypothetical protein
VEAKRPSDLVDGRAAYRSPPVVQAHHRDPTTHKTGDGPRVVEAPKTGDGPGEFGGLRTVEQGAEIIVRLATLPDDGPTAGFFDDAGEVAW